MQEVVLKAFMCLRPVYKDELQKWLKSHIKKGVLYTYLVRPETIDKDGYTHLHERQYCKPEAIKFDGQFADTYDFLPVLSIKKMNKLFTDAGLPPVNFEELSEACSPMYRVVLYMRDSGWIK